MNDQKLDKLFADKLAKYKVKPSADAWKRIDNQLGGENDKPFVWWQLMLAGFLFISLSVGAYSIYTKYNAGNKTVLNSRNAIEFGIQEFEIQVIKSLSLKNDLGKNLIEDKRIENQKNDLKEKLTAIDLSKNTVAKNTISKKADKNRKKKNTQSNQKENRKSGKLNKKKNEKKLELSKKGIPLSDKNSSLFDFEDEELILEKKKAEVEIKPIKLNPLTKKKPVKKKKIKVEITIPQSKKSKKKRKGGEQQTQGLALNFKSVLKNVLSN